MTNKKRKFDNTPKYSTTLIDIAFYDNFIYEYGINNGSFIIVKYDLNQTYLKKVEIDADGEYNKICTNKNNVILLRKNKPEQYISLYDTDLLFQRNFDIDTKHNICNIAAQNQLLYLSLLSEMILIYDMVKNQTSGIININSSITREVNYQDAPYITGIFRRPQINDKYIYLIPPEKNQLHIITDSGAHKKIIFRYDNQQLFLTNVLINDDIIYFVNIDAKNNNCVLYVFSIDGIFIRRKKFNFRTDWIAITKLHIFDDVLCVYSYIPLKNNVQFIRIKLIFIGPDFNGES